MNSAIAIAAPPVPARAAPEACPYKGLVPYREEDAALFFGRAAESEILAANLLASRLTVVYGASGVGKSSVLRAGLVHRLAQEEQARRAAGERPEYAVVVFASWRDDPVRLLEDRVAEAVRSALAAPGFPLPLASDDAGRLARWLEGVTRASGLELLVVLDQFEDLFLYHPGEEGPGSFVDELARAVNAPELRVNFVVALREDAVARLDVFKGRVPGVLRNMLRVHHLDAAGARAAITGPIDDWNKHHPYDPVESGPGFVDAVIEEVRAGRVLIGEAGRGGVRAPSGSEPEVRVEASYLQLVLTRLWAEEAVAGSSVLRCATLRRLGGAEPIVRDHLRDALADFAPAEQDLAAAAFRYLVTPSGGKIALSLADLAGYVGTAEAVLAPVLTKLTASSVRVLRPLPPPSGEPPERVRYEIFHDVLGKSVAAWRALHEQERRCGEAEGRVRKRWTRVAAMLGLLAGGMALTAAIAIRARRDEARARVVADLRGLAQAALANLDADPQLGLLLALRGASDPRASEVPELAEVLRRAVAESRARLPTIAQPDISAAAHHAGRGLVATADSSGVTTVWDSHTGARLAVHKPAPAASVLALTFDRAGRLLAAGSDDGAVRVWYATGTGSPLLETFWPTPPAASIVSIAFSPAQDAEASFVTGDAAGRVVLWSVGTGTDDLPRVDGHPRALGPPTGGRIGALAFSGNGRWLATGHNDGATRLWSVAGRGTAAPRGRLGASRELRVPELRINRVQALDVSPDGRRIATGNWDGKVRVFDLDERPDPRVRVVGRHANNVFAVKFSPDGHRIASASADGTARLWGAATGARLAAFVGHTGPVFAIWFDDDGQRLLSASWDGTVRAWDARGHADEVMTVAAAAKAPLLATGSSDGAVKIWNLETGAEIRSGHVHDGPVTIMQLSDDGARLATSGDDGHVKIWDTSSDRPILDSTFETEVTSIALSRDGTRVAQGSDRGGVWIWDVATKTRTPLPTTMPPQQMTVRFAPDGRLLVLTEWGYGRLWDCSAARCRSLQKDSVRLAPGVIMDAQFAPDGLLATAGLDGRLRFHDGTTLEAGHESAPHAQALTSLAFSGDGALLAYAGWDRLVRVLEVASRRELLAVTHRQGVQGVALGNHGFWLSVVGSPQGGFPHIYPVRDRDALRLARDRVVRRLTDDECRQYLPRLPCDSPVPPAAAPGAIADQRSP